MAAKAKGASQVTPIRFSQGISKCLHPDLGVSKLYQQNGEEEPNSLLMSK